MGSSGKKRTTRAKLDREGKLRQKRVDKESRRSARKLAAADEPSHVVFRSEELIEGSPRFDDMPLGAGQEPAAAAISDAASPGS